MKENGKKYFWGILIILCAVALLLYAIGVDIALFEVELYRLIFSFIIVALILKKLIFGKGIREKLKRVFFQLALIFCIMHEPINDWIAGGANVNDYVLIAAGILIDIGLGFILPKKDYEEKHFSFTQNTDDKTWFSNETRYIDATQTPYASVQNKMGNIDIYYQNVDLADTSIPLELNIINKMANITVHVPEDWEVSNKICTNMGNTTVRPNTASRIKLMLTGENKMGNIEVISNDE